MVYVRVGQEFSHLVALGIVVQHLEALVTEETRVARSQLVVGGQPPWWEEKNKTILRCELVPAVWNLNLCWRFNAPSDEDVADGALLCGHPVLVHEEWIQLLVQTVFSVGQPSMLGQWVLKKKKKIRRIRGQMIPQLCPTLVTVSAAFISTSLKSAHRRNRCYAVPPTRKPNLLEGLVNAVKSRLTRKCFLPGACTTFSQKNHILWQTHRT